MNGKRRQPQTGARAHHQRLGRQVGEQQVQPDHVGLTLANGGTASAQFALPNTPSLAGTVFRHQMVPLALDSTLAVTATNALTLTVGSF